MKKIVFLFIILLCAACTKDSDEKTCQTVYQSEPKFSIFPINENTDSVRIKGYNTCTCVKNYKTTLPYEVAKEFEMRDSYNYTTFNTLINLPEVQNDRIGFGRNSKDNSSIGYDSTFEQRVIYGSSGENYVGTYLIYVKSDTHGKEINRWLPIAPEEIEFNAYIINIRSF